MLVVLVVGEADEVAAQLVENRGVPPLQLVGQGAAETRYGLVAVAAVEVDPGAVEEEPLVGSELGAGDAETDAHRVLEA